MVRRLPGWLPPDLSVFLSFSLLARCTGSGKNLLLLLLLFPRCVARRRRRRRRKWRRRRRDLSSVATYIGVPPPPPPCSACRPIRRPLQSPLFAIVRRQGEVRAPSSSSSSSVRSPSAPSTCLTSSQLRPPMPPPPQVQSPFDSQGELFLLARPPCPGPYRRRHSPVQCMIWQG